jgi:hypothetical protein
MMSKREEAIKQTTDIFQAITKGIEQKSMTRHRATNFVNAILEAAKEQATFSKKTPLLDRDKP